VILKADPASSTLFSTSTSNNMVDTRTCDVEVTVKLVNPATLNFVFGYITWVGYSFVELNIFAVILAFHQCLAYRAKLEASVFIEFRYCTV
jgi:hypothetical protein